MKHEYYSLTDAREENLWKNAIFVFDSSALLDLYFLPKATRSKIFKDIFREKLKGRLWAPSHVKYEYLKNREKTIKKPIAENYAPLKDETLKKIQTSVNQIEKQINDLFDRTKNANKHPHLEKKNIDAYYEKLQKFKHDSEKFEETIKLEIKEIEESINQVNQDDDVAKAFHELFSIGREFSFNEIMKITKDGKHRFEFKIPPGYGDYYNGEKKGLQIFADLIIWNQILDYSKSEKKPIIFIINDNNKDEDWCYSQKSGSSIRIKAPREELIKEIFDYSGVEFWMYNLPQFLHLSNKYLESTIQENIIQNISYFLSKNPKIGSKILRFKCNKCKAIHTYSKEEIDLNFECLHSDEREMGTENQYLAEIEFNCDCGNRIKALFEVWEYPIGIVNEQFTDLDGGILFTAFDLSINFPEKKEIPTCEKCGKEYSEDIGTGLCHECEEEYNNN